MTTSGEIPLLQDYVSDVVDYRGHAAGRSNTGRWRAAGFIIGVEVAERFAYYGIASNLISYLTGPLGQSTAVAAANVNAWSGVSFLLPVLGAFVADAFLGRYRTIIIGSLVYVLGLALLTLSAFSVPVTKESPPSSLVNALFFCSLYLVAIGQGGHKPCVQAFGADQFDGKHPKEKSERSSFFNWWNLGMCVGTSLANLVVVYVQEAVSWALGFGIPCVFMVISLFIFLHGKKNYRYARRRLEDESNPLGNVFLFEAFRKDATALVRLIPIWLTTLIYAITYSQCTTFFTKQGVTMERRIVPGVEIPPASLLVLISISVLCFVPIYDLVLVPIARSVTKDPRGITMLRRIGTGMALASLTMVVAALVEKKRLETAKSQPEETVPMSIYWLIPQYLLAGLSDVFTLVGMQEFFYSQVPTELRSIGVSFYLSALGVGSLLSSLLVSIIGDTWFNNNLNRAHLDYFYWSLALLSAVGFFAFLFISKSYIYRRVDGV